MRILISGYYGSGNVGDEAVLQAIIRGIRDRFPGTELVVLSAAPKLTAELNQVKSIHRYSWWQIIFEMLRSDAVISGGGSLFQDVTSSRSFWYYIGIVLLARLLLRKVVIFAQGFGPLRKKINRVIARVVLDRVSLITLRDEESLREMQKLGISRPPIFVTADPSLILDVPEKKIGNKILELEGIPQRKLLGISVRSFPHAPQIEEDRFRSLAGELDQIAKKYDLLPVFVLFQCPQDMREASRIAGYMKESSRLIFRICRPQEMLSLISCFEILVGMRLHSLIFAAMSGVPMRAIAYDPKVTAFMKSIGQLGRDPEDIVAYKDAIKNDLASKRKDLYAKAVMNFELLEKAMA